MTVREYKHQDKERCVEIFQSNCPQFFDKDELPLFKNWLDRLASENNAYKSPTYTNNEKDVYYVVEASEAGIVACGGFYIIKDSNEGRLAWGMVHANFHRQGYGTTLYNYRKESINRNWPNHTLVLGTSQHTYSFYEKMGMTTTAILKSGYGPSLDKYDMIQYDA